MSVRYQKSSVVNILAKLKLFISKLVMILCLLFMGYPMNILVFGSNKLYVCALLHVFLIARSLFTISKFSFQQEIALILSYKIFSHKKSLLRINSQDLSLLSYPLRTEGLFCLCVTDQYFTHKIQRAERLRLKLSDVIEFT